MIPPVPVARERLDRHEQQRRIDDERRRAEQFRQQEDNRRRDADRRAREFERQRRYAQYRYQQDYWHRLYALQVRWNSRSYDYWNDPYYSTPASYGYSWGGRWYQTNYYGAELLQQAVDYGYREGWRAGQADLQDGWADDYQNSWAWQDASYGYHGYYVDADTYRYYFREGFRRGYQDAYYRQQNYGSRDSSGNAVIAAAIVGTILGLTLLDH